jgi:tetratricopeptide (TPR) repeat protein
LSFEFILLTMFIIDIRLRFALMAVLFLGGLLLSIFTGFWYGFPLILIGLVLLVGYILLGTVQSAAQLMQDGDMEAADKRLSMTLKPEWLYVTNRAYYYMLKGSIAMADKRMEEGEEYLTKAQNLQLPSDNEKAMIEMQFASMKANRGQIKQAEVHLRNLRNLKITEPMLKAQVDELEKALKQNKGAISTSARMGFRGQAMVKGGSSSKRRRPPMR